MKFMLMQKANENTETWVGVKNTASLHFNITTHTQMVSHSHLHTHNPQH